VHGVCCLAGSASLIDDIRAELRADGIATAIRRRDAATLFDWLVAALSYQGISNQVAAEYMERHGSATWADIDQKAGQGITCPKLKSYWHFYDCRYAKISRTCSERDHIDACPLPSHQLRNGRRNQMAYSLFLFIRDIADGDLVGWIDRQFQGADDPASPTRLAQLREAVIAPLREVYGVSDKVLTMSLSSILLGAPIRQSLYSEIIVTLAGQPKAAVGKDRDELPVATGLPRAWDEIAPGHLVIAQEALEYGWWEAIVIGRNADMFTLRYRDYPKLPKFVRHRNAIALISPPAE
jgi:hypothetical protein